jgi:hypothetical protein
MSLKTENSRRVAERVRSVWAFTLNEFVRARETSFSFIAVAFEDVNKRII